MPLIMRSPVSSRSSWYQASVSCISFPWVISQRLRAFSTRSRTRSQRWARTAQGGRNIVGLAENGAQHHRIFHRRAASWPISGWCCVRRRRAARRGPRTRRLNGSISWISIRLVVCGSRGGDKLLHRRRPAGKIAAEVGAQSVAILRQTRRQRHIKEK